MTAYPQRVVVTGLGVLAPNGIGVDEFWRTLVAGRSGIKAITCFDASKLKCRIAGEISDFDPQDFLGGRQELPRVARNTQLALTATSMAVADAKLELSREREASPVPVVIGVSTSCMDVIEAGVAQANESGGQFAKPYMVTASPPHSVSSLVARELGVNTRVQTLSSACAAGLDAVAAAAAVIRSGHADVAITGGSDAPLTLSGFASFAATGLLSGRNDDPAKASRPFDLERDGGVLSEGAGIMVLENYEHALARGVRPYLEVRGFGTGFDTNGHPPLTGLADTMAMALANSGLRPEAIDYICAHGPSDAAQDRVETETIKKVWGQRAYRVPVGSIKGVTGNPLAAAGPLQIIACALAMRRGVLPQTANYEYPDPECDLDYIAGESRRSAVRWALVNSHGIGGGNSSMAVRSLN